MQKDPYLILGLKDDATQQQVEDAYRALRKEYEEKCFAEGEEGARAARKLTELDQAYNDCLEDLQDRVKISDFGNVLKHVEALIKEAKNGYLHSLNPEFGNIELNENSEVHCMGKVIGKL